MIDLDKLEALAKAATPGPWSADGRDDLIGPIGSSLIRGEHGCEGYFAMDEDAEYCAAANPATILALIAEVRASRDRNKLAQNVVLYADSVCGMLRQGDWPGKAEALERHIKAVIDFDKENT